MLPVLAPGQLLVVDNYVIYKGARMEALVLGAGCALLYLPSYSPDPNPIELLFSKLQAWLRKATVRFAGLSLAIGRALDTVSLSDIRGYLSASGYERYLCAAL